MTGLLLATLLTFAPPPALPPLVLSQTRDSKDAGAGTQVEPPAKKKKKKDEGNRSEEE